ncbi:hypothetical protein [Paenibacillus aquistagni]|uniref:hypothetical protein n=1 Tax=Paenibacillus aquistagni TaxID=1852522 RepID=UPI000B50EE7F|nr:hypothetical protein [Paenibacillus aquistagni]
MKRLSIKQWVLYSLLAAACILVIVWASSYYSKMTFSIDDIAYSKMSETTNAIVYTSSFWHNHKQITVERISEEEKQVILNGEAYTVRQLQVADEFSHLEYLVTYPNGKAYRVEDRNGMLMAFDENGEWVIHAVAYSGGQRILQPDEEYYYPSAFVDAAYEQYHQPNGVFNLFLFAIAALAIGYSMFRFEGLRMWLFKFSYSLWVDHGEPSELYHYTSKGSGLFLMGFSVWVFFQSL